MDGYTKLIGVDTKTKLLVFGYIKHCEQLLISNDNRLNIIPTLIIHIVTWYYHTELFIASGPSIIIHHNRKKAVCMNSGRSTVYGQFCVEMNESMIYRWILKLKNSNVYSFDGTGLSGSVDIGICSSNKLDQVHSDNFSYGQFNYGSYSSGGRKHNYLNTFFGKKYGKSYGNGDYVEMELNTETQTLSFYKNKEYQGIAFEHIPMNNKYYLAISLGGEHDSVKLTDFYRTRITRKNRVKILQKKTMKTYLLSSEQKKLGKELYKLLKYKYPVNAKKIVGKILKQRSIKDIQYMISRKDVLFDTARYYQKFHEGKIKRYKH